MGCHGAIHGNRSKGTLISIATSLAGSATIARTFSLLYERLRHPHRAEGRDPAGTLHGGHVQPPHGHLTSPARRSMGVHLRAPSTESAWPLMLTFSGPCEPGRRLSRQRGIGASPPSGLLLSGIAGSPPMAPIFGFEVALQPTLPMMLYDVQLECLQSRRRIPPRRRLWNRRSEASAPDR